MYIILYNLVYRISVYSSYLHQVCLIATIQYIMLTRSPSYFTCTSIMQYIYKYNTMRSTVQSLPLSFKVERYLCRYNNNIICFRGTCVLIGVCVRVDMNGGSGSSAPLFFTDFRQLDGGGARTYTQSNMIHYAHGVIITIILYSYIYEPIVVIKRSKEHESGLVV